MRFLVDAQLPRRLAHSLNQAGHDALHTLDLPEGNRTTDTAINRLAGDEGRIVVTKDADFRDSHLLRGDPPKLLEIRTGNIVNAELLELVATNLPSIEEAFAEADHLELTRTELIVHARYSDS